MCAVGLGPSSAEFRLTFGTPIDHHKLVARHEEGTQTAAETLALGSGTCRDFAMTITGAPA